VQYRVTRKQYLDCSGPVYSFAGFTLDPGRASLCRDDIELPLRPKSFYVLQYLVRHPQRLVRREELLAAAWQGVVVTDDSLTQCLVEIRRAIGDETRCIVRTVPRRGYLLDVPVQISSPDAAVFLPDTSIAEADARGIPGAQRPPWRIPVSLFALAMVVAGIWWFVPVPGHSPVELAPSTIAPAHEPAQSVANLPEAGIGPRVTTRDLNARDLYQHGRLFYGRRMQGDIMRAQEKFEKALAIDPSFVAAWVSLAATVNLRWADSNVPESEKLAAEVAIPLMRRALQRALELDPRHPEALLRMARLAWSEGDEEKALRQILQALQSKRDGAVAQSILAGLAYSAGDLQLAIALQRRAIAMDPVSAALRGFLAQILYAAGQLEESEVLFRQVAELAPDTMSQNLEWLVWIKIHNGNYAAARDLADKLPEGPAREQAQAILRHEAGDRETQGSPLMRLMQRPRLDAAIRLACVFAARGDADAAFFWIAAATEAVLNAPFRGLARSELTELQTSPFLKPLHKDKRWINWLARTKRARAGDLDYRLRDMLHDYLAGDVAFSRQLAAQ
jgi:DNA-binding winged helix-turn-helix (wHTH) protein/Tfp pilus assembly protein PilF